MRDRNTGSDWVPIQFEGMIGDPSVVDPASVPAWFVRDCEIYQQKIRPRLKDRWVLPQNVGTQSPEWINGVYWIPHPIDFPLLRTWLSNIGDKGLFYTSHITAGYFLLDKNLHLVVRFMGYLEGNLGQSSIGEREAIDPTEFYSWMKTGYLQIVEGDIGTGYRCEVIRYKDAYIDENRRFRFTIVARGEKGTSPKSFSSGARLFHCFQASFMPAPKILGVRSDYAIYAQKDNSMVDFNPGLNDINEKWNRPVFVAPTISRHTEHNRDHPPLFGEDQFFTRDVWHGIAIHGKTDTSLNVFCYGKYPPRLSHESDNNYYNSESDRKLKNRIMNNWDVYRSDGYAYWRSLWVYRTIDSYDQWYSICSADHPRFPIFYWQDNGHYIPQVQQATFQFSGGRWGMAFFVLYPPDPDYYWFVYRYLKHPFRSAADASNFSRVRFDSSVMIFPRIIVLGLPLELESSPQTILRFRCYYGDTIPTEFTTQIPLHDPNATRPEYARPRLGGTPSHPFLSHQLKGNYRELLWSYENVMFRRQSKRLCELRAPYSPHLQVEFRNVTVELPENQDNVWAFAIGAFLNGTSRECGGPYIDLVHRRAYANRDVITHIGIVLLWDQERESYWELPAYYLGSDDTRQVIVFSPRYSGRIKGRLRAYSAILWRGGSASRAADILVQNFDSDWNSPLVEIHVPYAVKAGDVLVLYEMTGEPRAVGIHTFNQDINQPTVQIPDTNTQHDYPFVWATEPLPYGPAISYENRLLVLDQSIWCSALSDYPSFTAYPRKKGDGYRILLSSPVDRLITLENQAVTIGPRGSYRIVLGEISGDALPYPVSVGSDIPFLPKSAQLQDYNSYATRRGLVYGDKLIYLLPEDWLNVSTLLAASVVQTPYGPSLIRHYKQGQNYNISVLMPAVGTKGYSEYFVDLGGFQGEIVSTQWYDGLYIFFDRLRNISGNNYNAIHIAGGSERVSLARYESGAIRVPAGLRPRMMELYGEIPVNQPVVVRYYELRQSGAAPSLFEDMDIEQPYRSYPFDLSTWSRKMVQFQYELRLSSQSILEGGTIRLVGGVEP